MTLPWDDNGYRVLPAAAYMEHTEKMRELANQFTPAVESLVEQFEQLVSEAEVRLGGLFRADDYPTSRELRSKFSFETRVMPLPDAGDFRVALGDEEKERIKREITAAVEASLQVASRELWQRLYEAVKHMADRLGAYKVTEEGVEHPFRDSVIIMGKEEKSGAVRYLHGEFGQGMFTYYGGHDPEDMNHLVGELPTDVSLYPNSPGYRLILNNILFPAAKRKKLKT